MECTINWLPGTGMGFVAETGSGHFLTMDGAPDGGGRNLAPRPMETVLAGTGGCTAYDVVLILKRGRHDVRGCQVKVSAERAETDPKVFTRITMHFIVSGRGLPRGGGGARHRAVARTLLLGQHHAGARRPRSRPASNDASKPDRDAAAQRRSDAVRGGRHHLGGAAHQPAHRRRQRHAAGGQRVVGMAALVVLHGLDDGARTHVRRRQPAPGGRPGAPRPGARSRRRSPGSRGRPARPASRPMPKAPAYHSGLSRLARSPSSASRCCVQARWSVSSRAAWSISRRSSSLRAVSACAWYSACAQTSPTWLTRISAPESRRSPSPRSSSGRRPAGLGRAACTAPETVRRALSRLDQQTIGRVHPREEYRIVTVRPGG